MATIIAEKNIQIQCESNKAFKYFADLNNYEKWFPEVVQMKAVDNLPVGTIDKTYEEKVLLGDNEQPTFIVVKVKDFVDGKKIVTQAEFMPFLPQMTIQADNIGEGITLVTFKFESRSSDTQYLEGDGFKFLQSILSGRAAKGLDKLKESLEEL